MMSRRVDSLIVMLASLRNTTFIIVAQCNLKENESLYIAFMSSHIELLHKDGVVPDVIPATNTLSHELKVMWPEITLSTPGQEIDRQATQTQPKLFLSPVVRHLQKPF